MPLLDQLRERIRFPAGHTDMGGNRTTAFPRTSQALLGEAESQLGFALPPLLREIYLTVGNGGFGPGYGLLGTADGHSYSAGGRGWNVVELYHTFRRRPARGQRWGDKLLPICDWGCSYLSYIDCALPAAPVFALDEGAHGHGPWGNAFGLHAASLQEWMQRWVDGENLWHSFNAIGEPIFWFEEHPIANDNAQPP